MNKICLKKHRKKILLFVNIFILALIFLIFECTLRVLNVSSYVKVPIESDPILHHTHPQDIQFQITHPSGEFGGHYVHYDQDGLIHDPTSTKMQNQNEKYRVAFVGDSFVEALQVPFSKSFVGILQKQAKGNVTIKNYGVGSYSPVLYYLLWKNKIKNFQPTHVILLLYSNDMRNDTNYLQHAKFSHNSELIAVEGSTEKWQYAVDEYFYSARFLRKKYHEIRFAYSKEKSARVEKKIEEDTLEKSKTFYYLKLLADQVQEQKARFILMVVPSKQNLQGQKKQQELSEYVYRWSQKHNIEFLDLVVPFQKSYKSSSNKLFFDIDIHFNAQGHKTVANIIQKKIPQLFSSE